MYSIRRKPLTESQKKEICETCGHTWAEHHNPDDDCIICGCKDFELVKSTKEKRRFCVICGIKRYERYMVKYGDDWVCGAPRYKKQWTSCNLKYQKQQKKISEGQCHIKDVDNLPEVKTKVVNV